jgi:prophage antirepressor-like protein
VATFLAGMKKTQEFLYREEDHLKELCDYNQYSVETFQSVMAEFLDLNNPVSILSFSYFGCYLLYARCCNLRELQRLQKWVKNIYLPLS